MHGRLDLRVEQLRAKARPHLERGIAVFVEIKDGSTLFPLYPSKTQTALDLDAQLLGFGPDKQRANLSPAFVAQMGSKLGLRWQPGGRGDLQKRFGPEDVLAFIYTLSLSRLSRALRRISQN